MKATYSALILAAVSFGAAAQKVENDDMYFTAKDRTQLKSERVVVDRSPSRVQPEKKSSATEPVQQTADVAVNPTDSYSARNVNPEYSANSGQQGASTKSDYFVEDYRPTGVNGNLNGNYSKKNNSSSCYSCYYNNPYAYSPYSSFGNMGWGYPMGGMMGYGMSGFGYPYSPYGYGSSLSMMYGMGFGYPSMYSSMAFGFGYGSPYMGYGMYDPFMMSGFYNPYSFYGYASPYSSYYYPGTVVVDNGQVNGRNVAHAKRSDRSTSEQYQATGTRQAATTSRTGRALTSNGRTRSTEGTQAYYERGWRNNRSDNGTQASTSRSFWNQNQNPSSASSGQYNNSGRTSGGSSWSNWDNHNSGSNWNTGGNSRSSWNTGGSTMHSGGASYGGGSRSSMGGSGGATGGHSRGRD